MKRIQPSDNTKYLFAPFFDLSKYLNGSEPIKKRKYKEMVDLCLSSFYGDNKLSANRQMYDGSGILYFISGIDNNLLLECFIRDFKKKITKKKRDSFLLQIYKVFADKPEEIGRIFKMFFENCYMAEVVDFYNLKIDILECYDNCASVQAYFQKEILKNTMLDNNDITNNDNIKKRSRL